MPVYAVCNNQRTVRKTLLAEDLEELKRKGCAKLSLPKVERILLSSNGCEVEDDEVLASLSHNDMLVLLCMGQEYLPLVYEKTTAMPVRKVTPRVNSQVTVQANAEASVTQIPEEDSKDHRTSQTWAPRSASPSGNVITPDTPLPTFSSFVEQRLRAYRSEEVWSKMIRESAFYYHNLDPNFGKVNPYVYTVVGEEMVKTYPDIKRHGNNYWSVFTKDLSARIRHIRWAEKKQSDVSGDTYGCTPAKMARKQASEPDWVEEGDCFSD